MEVYMKCFYHKTDLDGQCSGAIVKLEHPECEMFGINYGDEFPWDKIRPDETVYMVDFSLQPFDQMVKLNTWVNLIWIDHHKTAIEEWEKHGQPEIGGIRVEGMAGCELTWRYLHSKDMPYAVHLLGRHDVWDHHNPNVLPFQYALRLYDWNPDDPINIARWRGLLFGEQREGSVLEYLHIGKIVLAYQKQQYRTYANACSFETEIDGLKVIAANAQLANSQLFDSVWDDTRHDAMLTFGWRKGRWSVSLYTSKPGIDVGTIAKARGGGGHAGAAGFQCNELPFEL